MSLYKTTTHSLFVFQRSVYVNICRYYAAQSQQTKPVFKHSQKLFYLLFPFRSSAKFLAAALHDENLHCRRAALYSMCILFSSLFWHWLFSFALRISCSLSLVLPLEWSSRLGSLFASFDVCVFPVNNLFFLGLHLKQIDHRPSTIRCCFQWCHIRNNKEEMCFAAINIKGRVGACSEHKAWKN